MGNRRAGDARSTHMSGKVMKAGSRLGLAVVAAGLALAPLPALAQNAAPSTTNMPAPDSVGPRELQNFSLGGTVTKPADTPTPSATASAPRDRPRQTVDRPQTIPATREPTAPPARQPVTRVASAPPQPKRSGQPQALDLAAAASATPASIPQPGFAMSPDLAPATLAPEQKMPLWPWLLLAVVLGAGGAALLWRRRSREAIAGAPKMDAFVAPEPAPAPPRAAVPEPVPAPPSAPRSRPKPVGVVSSRLRPWIDLVFAPIGCIVDDDRVTLEFEIQLTNSGSAPARDILVEASLFNAGATQEQDIGAFFANPVGQGERIEMIAPLQHVVIRTSLIAPLQNIQIFEIGGRKVFVPLAAFNVLYRAPGGGGQSSLAYMLGRETTGEKLGPLRADLGPRTFTGLGTRPLPIGVRT
jgi:hypothetical protein